MAVQIHLHPSSDVQRVALGTETPGLMCQASSLVYSISFFQVMNSQCDV
jgi:hypothetical protein